MNDGITAIAFADNMLYSGAYDHSIRSWDLKEMYNRIRERAIMYKEDINVRLCYDKLVTTLGSVPQSASQEEEEG
jgi:hypothetical protein